MRRIALTIVAVALLAALVLAATASGEGDGGDYKVRAIFDNGGFIVPGEDVRVAGANVGSVESVDVTMPGEVVSLEGGAHDVPGKAVVVLDIATRASRTSASDASCLIRPQSLIGEKFVDCTPTVPRAPGSEPPPAARADPGRRDRRGPVPPAAREQRQGRRHRPGQQHHARCRTPSASA